MATLIPDVDSAMKKRSGNSEIRRLTTSFLVLLVAVFMNGCGKYNYDESDDLFFVRNKGADMPVWVRGNTASGVFIIAIHGGPGGSAIFGVYMDGQPGNGKIDHESPLKILEKTYAMVYWDQRHSGNSQGNANPDETTVEDFADDLDLVIDALNERHNVSKLFLIGQSWGHTVATAYLTLGDNWQHRQTKIDGYIDYKGNISFNMAYQYAKPRLLAIADQRISSSEEADYWTDAKIFLQENGRLETADDALEYSELVDKAMDVSISIGQRIGTSIEYSFFSPHNGWYHWANYKNTMSSGFLERLITDDRLVETAHRIQIPTLLIYGRLDLTAPFEVGEWHYGNIELPSNEKELVILENSRHGAEGDDVQILQDAIANFVDRRS
jgi:proline iminopeptidase